MMEIAELEIKDNNEIRGCPISAAKPLYPSPLPLLIDLQWFASPEDEGRTEQPTESKLRRAREEEGRVPKSQELTAALGLLFTALCLVFLARTTLRSAVELVRFFFTRITDINPVQDRAVFMVFARYFLRMSLPIMLVAMAAGIFGHIVQSGFIWTTKPLRPDFSKIVPHFGQYFSRTIFSLNGLYNFGKSLIKMAIIGGAAFIIVRGDIEKIANLQKAQLWQGVTLVSTLTAKLLIATAVLLLILSVPDYLFQRYQFMRQMKMSRLEVQEERKREEGDPLVKSRIRQQMRRLLSQNLRQAVTESDVVITNPTHLACAIQYDRTKMEAPTLAAKGEDEVAARIRQIAHDNEVPIVENKPLARAIYQTVEVGDVIPEKYFDAIVAILIKVWGINEARRRAGVEA